MMSRISRDLAAHHAYSRSPSRAVSSRRSSSPTTPRVAIVGAGFSGLRCADILIRNGANVTIFEARNRIGGRVHQHTDGQHTFDMGPNWIHGTEGNPIMDLAKKTDTVILEPEESQIVFDQTGKMKPEKDATELGADNWAIIVNAFKYSNEHCLDIDPQRSLYDYFKDEMHKRFPNDENQVRERLNEARMWGPFIGDPIDRQSLRNFYLEQCLDGENVLVASTYSGILAEVAKRAQEAAVLQLGKQIVKIDYHNTSDIERKVVLTTAHGERDSFDEVVVTCPLGWLKRHQVDVFSPPLPLRLSQAIENIGYGNLEKIYITFPSAWWTTVESDNSSNSTSSSPSTSTTVDEQTPLFFHFHHPIYHPDPASKENEFWNQALVSLAHFPGSAAKPTLLLYMYGPCSRHVTSLIEPHKPDSEAYNALLHDFVEPFISRLPSYSTANPVCKPTSFVATQWSNDPLAGYGSYSNFQIGLVQGDEDIECMRNAGGLSDDGKGLWLAGEHTAPFVAIGTTTGAYWSGEAVARRILDRYGIGEVTIGEEMPDIVVIEGQGKKPDQNVKDGANTAAMAI